MHVRRESATDRDDLGFTLVELAIVLVIIGLIIGGVLRGQEMIESARIKSGISQFDAVRAAHITFVDKYGAWPGDLPGAADLIPGAPAWSFSGNGDYVMDGRPFTEENLHYWQHLAAAGMISGVEVQAEPNGAFGVGIPSFAIDGGLVTNDATIHGLLTGWFYVVRAFGDSTGVLSGQQVFEIDQKLDDARPTSGDVRVDGSGCFSGDAYNRASGVNCRPFVRFP